MNKCYFIGNITKDPDLTETDSGIAVCKFSIAVNRRRAGDGEQQTDFFNVTAWRGLGENVAKYCRKGSKGSKVCVVGRIELRQYESRDGVKKLAVDVVAEEVEFLTPKPVGERKPELTEFDDDGDIPF